MSEATFGGRPQFGIGTLVLHPAYGRGRVLGYTEDSYRIVFKGGEVKRVGFGVEGLTATEVVGDPELNRIKQAVREVLGEYGWLEAELEMLPRWRGGMMKLVPGKEDTQAKEIPIEAFFGKIIGIREKLRVLEQKINNHASLSDEEKLELEAYITRCYGSLTTFNVLFAAKESQFKGQGKD